MFIPEEEEVHRDAEPDVHVDRDRGAGPRVVVHQDHLTIMTISDASDNHNDNDAHHHHPAPPLVSLVPVHDAGVGGLLCEENSHDLTLWILFLYIICWRILTVM